jgi:KaiC/GvpD/RAD55 family RecA-like ATPase
MAQRDVLAALTRGHASMADLYEVAGSPGTTVNALMRRSLVQVVDTRHRVLFVATEKGRRAL